MFYVLMFVTDIPRTSIFKLTQYLLGIPNWSAHRGSIHIVLGRYEAKQRKEGTEETGEGTRFYSHIL